MRTEDYVFAGLRFSEKKLESLFNRTARQMKNSSAYKLIFIEGREGLEKGLDEQKQITTRKMLVHFARRRLGAPDEKTRTKLEAIPNVRRLSS